MAVLVVGCLERIRAAVLCRQGRLRRVARLRWCRWCPGEVRHPRGEGYYSDAAAFEAIAGALDDSAIEVVAVALTAPESGFGYELLIPQGLNGPCVYAEVQLGAGLVLGRNFHYRESRVKS